MSIDLPFMQGDQSPQQAKAVTALIQVVIVVQMLACPSSVKAAAERGAHEVGVTADGEWTSLSPSGSTPDPRADQSEIYDPVRDRLVVFGGFLGGSTLANDLWALSLGASPAWTQVAPAGELPRARELHSAIFDPIRDRMLMFGGATFEGHSIRLNDVWALSLAGSPIWIQLSPAGPTPSTRHGHSAIYDPVRDRMLVFGGYDGVGAGYANDVWALSLGPTPSWVQLFPTGTPPTGLWRHTAIYDPVRDRMLVFGGSESQNLRNQVWALSLTGTPAWSLLVPSGTPPIERHAHQAIYDPRLDGMVIFGGVSLASPMNDTWVLSLASSPAWGQMNLSAPLPSPRGGHSAIYHGTRNRLIAFGGWSEPGYLNDVWALDLPVVAGVSDQLPQTTCGLMPPVPSPTRGRVSLSYYVNRTGHVDLRVFDVNGRLVRVLVSGQRSPGSETVVWNGDTTTGEKPNPGIYFVRLESLEYRETRRVVLIP